ncbi:NUDIX domain-containing protein [Hydrogenimonas sp.]
MKTSAGILPFRKKDGALELYLVHMGGPYWKRRARAWSIVKGELEEGEEPLEAAKREFYEETGQRVEGDFIHLGEVKIGNKRILAWAVEAEPSTRIVSNTFTIEWPPKSGHQAAFPEVDEARWFGVEEARKRIVASQIPFIERLMELVQHG